MSARHPIPPPSRRGCEVWPQPDRAEIEVDGTHALMSADTFSRLPEHDRWREAVWTGKMWRTWLKGDTWLLYWWDETEGGAAFFQRREIIVA